jgi:hypothetical protein
MLISSTIFSIFCEMLQHFSENVGKNQHFFSRGVRGHLQADGRRARAGGLGR